MIRCEDCRFYGELDSSYRKGGVKVTSRVGICYAELKYPRYGGALSNRERDICGPEAKLFQPKPRIV